MKDEGQEFEPVRVSFNQGEVTARPKEDLKPGELTKSVGAEYRLRGDDVRLSRIPGRKFFGTVRPNENVDGLKICRFDDVGDSRLLAMTESGLFVAPIGDTGAFTQIAKTRAGLTNDSLSAAHVNDRWFIVIKSPQRSAIQNLVLMPGGATRAHGMNKPMEVLGVAIDLGLDPGQEISFITVDNLLTVNPVPRPGPESYIPWKNPDNVAKIVVPVDGGPFASAEYAGDPFDDQSGVSDFRWRAEWGFSDTGSGAGRGGRWVEIKYFVEAPIGLSHNSQLSYLDYYRGTINISVSQDGGASYNQALNASYGKLPGGQKATMSSIGTIRIPIFLTDDTVLNSQLKVNIMFIADLQSSATSCRIYSIRIMGESGAVTTDPEKQLNYGFTEVDEINGLESELSPIIRAGIVSAGGVFLTFPEPLNDNTTHFYVYRTPEFSVVDPDILPTPVESLSRMGYVQESPVIDLDGNPLRTVRDDLVHFNIQTFPLLDLITLRQSDGSLLYYPANRPPPPMSQIASYRNALVGVNGRNWFQSLPAQPDKWPELLAIDSFPLEENDVLVACMQVGNALVVGATGVMLAIDDPPRIINQAFYASKPRKIAEIGLVNQNAMTTVSQGSDKEDLAAWVSTQGIHVTNTYTSRTITDDIDWKTNVSVEFLESATLDFDIDTQQLKFGYDSDGDGVNDRFALIHMSPKHLKENGLPRCTWSHYGTLQSIDSQIIEGTLRQYSGDEKGNIYLERAGTRDDSLSFNSNGDIPFDVGVHINGDWRYVQAYRGSLRNFKSSKMEMTITIDANLETIGEVQRVVENVILNGRPVEFLIDRMGESLDISFHVEEQGDLELLDCRIMLGVASEVGM